MRKFKGCLILGFWLLMMLLLVLAANEKKHGWWNGRDDLRMAVLAKDGMGVVSFSPERKMINSIKLTPDIEIWIPGGLGRYKVNRIQQLLVQENKTSLVKDIFFYNFGFSTNEVLWLQNFDDWKDDQRLIWYFGMPTWMRIKWMSGQMLSQDEEINQPLEKYSQLGEIMLRDFADNRVLKEDIRLSVYNSSGQNGLASWIANRLEWSGLGVVGLETSGEKVDSCKLLISDEKQKKSQSYQLLNRLWKCDQETSKDLAEGEMELYLGEKFGEMIKYPSY